MGFQYTLFVLTPDELKIALEPFTLLTGNARVPVDYISTPTESFINNYKKFSDQLISGEKIDYRNHNGILDYFSITTDINSIQWKICESSNNLFKIFSGSTRGYAPYFAPFTFSAYEEHNKIFVGTKASWMVEYTDIMGFQLIYPKLTKSEAEHYGVSTEKDWESYSDYKLFRSFLIKNADPLCFMMNGIKKTTNIYVSAKSKCSLEKFHCIQSNGIEII